MLRSRRTVTAIALAGAIAGFGLARDAVAEGKAVVPAGWKLIKDHKGTCQMIVPSEWKGDMSAASPEDKQGMASIHLLPGKDWEESRVMSQQVMVPTTVLEDSAERLWYAYGSNPGETDWYVLVPGPRGPCAAQVTFKNDTVAETAKLIAASVAAVPDPAVK